MNNLLPIIQQYIELILGWPLVIYVAAASIMCTVMFKFVQFRYFLRAWKAINTVVVGLPKTLRGTESEQTLKIKAYVELLKNKFPKVTWIFWDERMTSKQAESIKKIKNKEDKLQSHAIAAALVLGSYLDYLEFQKRF